MRAILIYLHLTATKTDKNSDFIGILRRGSTRSNEDTAAFSLCWFHGFINVGHTFCLQFSPIGFFF